MRKRDGVRFLASCANVELAWSLLVFAHIRWLVQGKETFVSTKREMDGKVVGEGAVPLGQETIGARLLLSMGWSGGGLVGTHSLSRHVLLTPLSAAHHDHASCQSNFVGTNGEGIAEPLMAIVKNNRKGLGF
jgi:hypothetical protein